MHENERAAPVVNTSARRIPADAVVEKLAVGFMTLFLLYMYVGRGNPDSTFFQSFFKTMPIGADGSKPDARPLPAWTTADRVLCALY
jgi:hypothetical protein